MSKPKVAVIAGLILVATLVTYLFLVSGKITPNTEPSTQDGRPWRLAYYEGGPFYDYPRHLLALSEGLAELGWLEPPRFPAFEDKSDSRLVWEYLATEVESDYVEFVPDAYWSAAWDEEQRVANRAAALERLNSGDIDLVIAMGTWAGLDLANDEHDVPTVVMSASDALGAGIIESVEDSGYDHVHAWVDPDQYLRQALLFHDIFQFERLGYVYEDTPDGRTYGNVKALTQMAEARGVVLVPCTAPDAGLTEVEARDAVARCLEELAPIVDAMWLSGGHRGFDAKFFPALLDPLFDHQVVTWSALGSEHVERGVVMSVARKDVDALGLWSAEVVARNLNGASPRDLEQVFELPHAIVLNLAAAERVAFRPPAGLLEAADKIYPSIKGEDGW